MPCLIKKASRCVADRMLKQQRFLSFTFYIAQRSYKKIMCICLLFDCFSGEYYIIILYLYYYIVLYLHFLYTKDDKLPQIKIKHE